jgi:hypothetical protein
MKLNQNFEKYLFGYPFAYASSQISAEIFLASDIYSIPESMIGVYAWYIYPHAINTSIIESYTKLYKNRKYKVQITDKFKEKHTAYTSINENLDNTRLSRYDIYNNSKLFKDILNLAFLTMSPPLYIGRSKNLRHRLAKHAELLSFSINNNRSTEKSFINNYDINESDSDKESQYFGARIADHLNKVDFKNNNFGISNFYIKLIGLEEKNVMDENREEVMIYFKDLEYILLRSYKPIISKK